MHGRLFELSAGKDVLSRPRACTCLRHINCVTSSSQQKQHADCKTSATL